MAVSFGDGDFLLLISSAASARVKFLHCAPRKPSLLLGGGGVREGIGITYPQSQSFCGTRVLHACVSRNRCQPSTNFFVT